MFIYCVRDLDTGKYLNTSGKWSKNIFALDVQKFNSEESATKSFVKDVNCHVTRIQAGRDE